MGKLNRDTLLESGCVCIKKKSLTSTTTQDQIEEVIVWSKFGMNMINEKRRRMLLTGKIRSSTNTTHCNVRYSILLAKYIIRKKFH